MSRLWEWTEERHWLWLISIITASSNAMLRSELAGLNALCPNQLSHPRHSEVKQQSSRTLWLSVWSGVPVQRWQNILSLLKSFPIVFVLSGWTWRFLSMQGLQRNEKRIRAACSEASARGQLGCIHVQTFPKRWKWFYCMTQIPSVATLPPHNYQRGNILLFFIKVNVWKVYDCPEYSVPSSAVYFHCEMKSFSTKLQQGPWSGFPSDVPQLLWPNGVLSFPMVAQLNR